MYIVAINGSWEPIIYAKMQPTVPGSQPGILWGGEPLCFTPQNEMLATPCEQTFQVELVAVFTLQQG